MDDIKCESDLQITFMNWLYQLDPEAFYVTHHIPNGGQRTAWAGKRLKAEGVKAGIPDIFMPIARHGYHGLYIEFKWGYNKLSEKQRIMMGRLSRQGYLCRTCYDLQSAQAIVKKYLGMEYVQSQSA